VRTIATRAARGTVVGTNRRGVLHVEDHEDPDRD